MASLPTRSFSAIVQSFAAGVQGRAAALIDFSTGSTLRAIGEGVAAITLWLQSVALKILTATRAATSTGADLDSFVNDYGMMRLGASYAAGQVTFARYTAAATAITIPVGTQVRTSDDSQIFIVVADTTYGTYSASAGGYVLASTVASIAVPVEALMAGTGGNVSAGTITQILSSIDGIDTVTNASAFSNAIDSESDAALRLRFVAYINQLSKGTKAAVEYAISLVGTNIQYQVVENENTSGVTDYGFFYAVVDDGTGSPPSSTLNAANAAIEAVRPLTVAFTVIGPTVATANVAMTITSAAGYDHSSVIAIVSAAITANINALGLGNSLFYTQLIRWAYQASPGVTNVSAVTVNSGTSDIVATAKDTIKAGTMTIA